ncbi:YBR056W-like protein [Klebsiella pneumoniae]|nr:YBR056W-like protein [Klebsiella pneumoniae]
MVFQENTVVADIIQRLNSVTFPFADGDYTIAVHEKWRMSTVKKGMQAEIAATRSPAEG